MRIVVIGGGRQGIVIAKNLMSRPEKPQVCIVDVRQPANLPVGVTFEQADVTEPQAAIKVATGADAVVLAVPSEISHQALKNVIAAGVPVADVCFTPDPPLDLDALAKTSGTCCVVDVGVAPGLSHILAATAYAELGGLDSCKILVGGMPQDPPAVFQHAVYFNPHDLLAEYIRPARARKGGKDIDPAPLEAEIETRKDEELGHLEAFISDGLRSLLTSFKDIPDMSEWTLRWPGHLETMRNLRALGLLESAKAVQEAGTAIANRFPADSYPDVLLMIVEASKGKERREWRLIDRRTDGESAMSRTTGYTTAAVAMLLANKKFTEPGVHAPERLGKEPHLGQFVIDDLSKFGVKVTNLVAGKV